MNEFGNDHPALRRCWHPIARSSEIGAAPRRAVLLGSPGCSGGPTTGSSSPSPIAARTDGPRSRWAAARAATLRCAYHGWRFDAVGHLRGDPLARARGDRSHRGPPRRRRPASPRPTGWSTSRPEDPLNAAAEIMVDGGRSTASWSGDLPVSRPGSGRAAGRQLPRHGALPLRPRRAPSAPRRPERSHPTSSTATGLSHGSSSSHAFANREDPGVRPACDRSSSSAGSPIATPPRSTWRCDRLPRRRRHQHHRLLPLSGGTRDHEDLLEPLARRPRRRSERG